MRLNIPIGNLPESIDLVSLDPPSQPYPRMPGPGHRARSRRGKKQQEFSPPRPHWPWSLMPPPFPHSGKIPTSHSPEKARTLLYPHRSVHDQYNGHSWIRAAHDDNSSPWRNNGLCVATRVAHPCALKLGDFATLCIPW